jgi:hypothetical protein
MIVQVQMKDVRTRIYQQSHKIETIPLIFNGYMTLTLVIFEHLRRTEETEWANYLRSGDTNSAMEEKY